MYPDRRATGYFHVAIRVPNVQGGLHWLSFLRRRNRHRKNSRHRDVSTILHRHESASIPGHGAS